MIQILVKFKDNWADEFDVEGFRIMSKEEWDEYEKGVNSLKYWPQGLYFGTNEGIEYSDAKDYLSYFEIKELTLSEEKIIKKLFGSKGGHFLEFTMEWKYYTEPCPLN